MKRIGSVFDRIASFENLHAAYVRARRGKRHRASVDAFTFGLEPELLRLRRELLDGTYRPGPFVAFEIFDPKQRTIHAAPLRDRILHQAIIGVLEPRLERTLDPDSFACRRGKGVDSALARAWRLTRPETSILRTDIRHCFPSIDHAVLKDVLERRIKDRRLLRLLELIVDHGGANSRGIPIGSLTSQWFANLVLDRLDRFVRHELRPRGYLRYMDDVALLDEDRALVREFRAEIAHHVREELRLDLNLRVTAIHRGGDGWPFLGFRVLPAGLRLRRETWRRFRKRLGSLHHDYRRGRIDATEFATRAASLVAHIERGGSRSLRRKEMRVAEI